MSLPHHKLVAWQRADDLFIEVHQLTQTTFPREEKYELSSQLRRAAYSVPANIVEGLARQFPKERFHFLSIASASLAEVGYGLHAARRLGYLLPEQYDALELKVRQVAAPARRAKRRALVPKSPIILPLRQRCLFLPLPRRALCLVEGTIGAPGIGAEAFLAGHRQHVTVRAVIRNPVFGRLAPSASQKPDDRRRIIGRGIQ